MRPQEVVEELVDRERGSTTPRDWALEKDCRGVFFGQMLVVSPWVTGPLSAVQGTLFSVSGNVQDHVLCGIQPEDLAGDPLEVVPEGDPVRGEEWDGEEIVL